MPDSPGSRCGSGFVTTNALPSSRVMHCTSLLIQCSIYDASSSLMGGRRQMVAVASEPTHGHQTALDVHQ